MDSMYMQICVYYVFEIMNIPKPSHIYRLKIMQYSSISVL